MSTKQRKKEIVLPTSGRKMQEITMIVRSSLHRHLLPQQNVTIRRHVLVSGASEWGKKLINLFVAAPESHTKPQDILNNVMNIRPRFNGFRQTN